MTNAIWMPGYAISREAVEDGVKTFLVECLTTVDACPKCGVIGRLYKHGTDEVSFQDAPSFGVKVIIRVRVQRYRCRECGSTSVQPLPGMDSRRQMTKRCVEYIAREGVEMTFSALARQVGVHEKTVRMICHEAFAKQMDGWKAEAPRILGMDELWLAGAARAIFVDVGQRRALDLLPSRKSRPVAIWLSTLPHKERVQLVAIDMWRPYRELIRTFLPKSAIVVGKFHVVSMANRALDRVRNDVRRAGKTKKERKNPRGNRFLMHKRGPNLDPMAAMRLDGMLANNPLFKAAYEAKERFYDVWEADTRADAERLYDDWKGRIDPSVQYAYDGLVGAVTNWRSEIFSYFDYPATNAFAENRNGIIKMANRAGRGYSFEAIRAKALLAKPLARMGTCFACQRQHPAKLLVTCSMGFRGVGPNGEDEIIPYGELCGDCQHIFHTEAAPGLGAWIMERSTVKSE